LGLVVLAERLAAQIMALKVLIPFSQLSLLLAAVMEAAVQEEVRSVMPAVRAVRAVELLVVVAQVVLEILQLQHQVKEPMAELLEAAAAGRHRQGQLAQLELEELALLTHLVVPLYFTQAAAAAVHLRQLMLAESEAAVVVLQR
jgi:hypothetical protein